MEFSEQKQKILSIFEAKGVCENGVAQLQFAEQIKSVIDYFKANHVFSLREGLISTEKLQEFGLTDAFAARDCYFGKSGSIKATTSVVLVDCTVQKLSVTGAVEYIYLKNSTVENIYLLGANVKSFHLYDRVTVKNINLTGSAAVKILRLTNSTVKVLRIDGSASIENLRRATKTINEVVGAERIKNILTA